MVQARLLLSRAVAPLNNLRLRYKVLLLSVLLVVLATSLTGLYSYRVAAGMLTDQAYAQSRDTVGQAANFLDEKLRNILWLSFFLQTDPTVQTVLSGQDWYGTGLSNVQPLLSSLRIREKTVDAVVISTPGGDYYETVNIANIPFRETDLYLVSRDRMGFTWFLAHPDPLFRDGRPSLTLVLPATVPLYVEDSYIIVNLSADWFEEYLAEGAPGSGGFMLLVDGAGKPVVAPPAGLPDIALPQLGETRSGTTEIPGKEPYILNHAAIPVADWQLVLLQPKAALMAPANAIRVASLMVMAVAVAISGVLSLWLANSIAKPLDRLRALMWQIEQRNFATTFKARYDDEIGDLGRAFNQMTGRLDELVGQVEAEQRSKRHAELRALQAQMNPHFLYNTLDSIYWKAQLQDHQAVGEMVVALSRLLRLGLNKGDEMTTVARELEHTEIYLRLQKRNYEHQFEYLMDADPECLDYICPKLILQPIVENCLLHGFAAMTTGGLIHIRTRLDGGTVVLTVTDNGCGMPDGLEGLPRSGYALRNVAERIRLHFGAEYGLSFHRPTNGGATVQVTLPARTLARHSAQSHTA